MTQMPEPYDPRKKIYRGDSRRRSLSPETINRLIDGTEAALAGANQYDTGQPTPEPAQRTLADVQNATGELISEGDVVAIDTPLIVRATDEYGWLGNLGFVATKPVAATASHVGRIAIAVEPIAVSPESGVYFLGQACVAGICKARVTVTDASHEYADVDQVNGGFRLVSQSGGSSAIEILEKEGGWTATGADLWCTVRIRNHVGVHLVGKVTAVTSEPSGTSPGEADVDVHWLNQTTDELEPLLDASSAQVTITARTFDRDYDLLHCDRYGVWWIHATANAESDSGSGSSTSDSISGSSSDLPCNPAYLYLDDIQCEDGILNVYRYYISISINESGCLETTKSQRVLHHTAGCCECEPGSSSGSSDSSGSSGSSGPSGSSSSSGPCDCTDWITQGNTGALPEPCLYEAAFELPPTTAVNQSDLYWRLINAGTIDLGPSALCNCPYPDDELVDPWHFIYEVPTCDCGYCVYVWYDNNGAVQEWRLIDDHCLCESCEQYGDILNATTPGTRDGQILVYQCSGEPHDSSSSSESSSSEPSVSEPSGSESSGPCDCQAGSVSRIAYGNETGGCYITFRASSLSSAIGWKWRYMVAGLDPYWFEEYTSGTDLTLHFTTAEKGYPVLVGVSPCCGGDYYPWESCTCKYEFESYKYCFSICNANC